jgi:hypothetical protein
MHYLKAFREGWDSTTGKKIKQLKAGGCDKGQQLHRAHTEVFHATLELQAALKKQEDNREQRKAAKKAKMSSAEDSSLGDRDLGSGMKGETGINYYISEYLRTINLLFSSPLASGISVFGWLIMGMVFYHFLNDDFNWGDSLYFSVQAGMSIGFGSLAETSDASRTFSCFHMIAGGLILSTIVGSLYSNTLEVHRSFKQQVQEETTQQLIEMRKKRNDLKLRGSQLLAIEKKLSCYNRTKIAFFDFAKTLKGKFVVATAVLFLWTLLGVVFAMDDQKMTGAEAWEFAISAATTGGLMGFNTITKVQWTEWKGNITAACSLDSSKNDWSIWDSEVVGVNSLGAGPALFCALYCAVGVPLYGYWLGTWIAVLMNKRSRDEAKEDAQQVAEILSEEVKESYKTKVMPLIYPAKEEGGFLSPEAHERKKQRIDDGIPSLVDSFILAALNDSLFGNTLNRQLDYLEAFKEGWCKTVGQRVLDGVTNIDENMADDDKKAMDIVQALDQGAMAEDDAVSEPQDEPGSQLQQTDSAPMPTAGDTEQ